MSTPALPIDGVLPEILAALECDGAAATIASPPGSGKTTRVPPALAGMLGGRSVLVLEPRRIAARAAARRVAGELGVAVGREVGYEVRDDRRVSRDTVVAFLTEGILVRRLLADPFLDGVGAVVLDEFHERHVDTDLALAMLREVRDTVRPDLRIVAMSATLDIEPLATFLEPCARIAAEGRLHEVRVEYEPAAGDDRLEQRVLRMVRRACRETEGDVLVFLPGMAEIRRAASALSDLARSRDVEVLPLHGSLDSCKQDAAIRRGSRRKVVLSTNVAESSVTIEGVTAVVDSGLARVLRHDVARGLDSLRVERISRASATQRAGRAGRTAPGVCYRLWSLAEERGMNERDTPEIRRVDLAGPSLSVHVFAGRDPRQFDWFETPEIAALSRASQLLTGLGLVNRTDGLVSADGRAAGGLPVHPRFARMLLEAKRRGCARAAAELAALLSEREPRGSGLDVRDALAAFRDAERSGFVPAACASVGLDRWAARRVATLRDRMLRSIGVRCEDEDEGSLAHAVVAGFPDRVAVLRGPPDCERKGQLASGRGIALRDAAFSDVDLCVALRVEDRGEASRSIVRLALPIDQVVLEDVFPDDVVTERIAAFDDKGRVSAVQRTRFRDLVFEESRGGRADSAAVEDLLAREVRRDPWRHLGQQRRLRAFLARAAWLRDAVPDLALPRLDDVAVGEAAAQLSPGKRALRDFRDAPVLDLLEAGLAQRQRAALRRDAPDRLVLPSGRELSIEYDPSPHVAARLQEFFGMPDTPKIAGGRVPVTLHLLAPNRRPVQITDDLGSFWDTIYPSVRTELRNRYPKHSWPEDPRSARPDSPGRRRRPRK